MLELNGISKTFIACHGSKRIKPLDSVSLSVKENRKIGLVGPSGCGKTTLSRIAMKLISPDSGSIVLDGEDVTDYSDRRYRPLRNKVQMVFQNPYSSLDPMKSMRWSLDETYRAFGRSSPSYAELCKTFEIPMDILNRRPIMVSGGEMQRISIMRCMAIESKYVILDEPTSMLDISTQASIMTLINDLVKKESRGVLLITHDLDLAEAFCDDIYLMNEGRIIESGPADEVLNDPVTPEGKEVIEMYNRKLFSI